jgi:hypothetical protein
MFKSILFLVLASFSSLALAAPNCTATSSRFGALQSRIDQRSSGEEILILESPEYSFLTEGTAVVIEFLRQNGEGAMPAEAVVKTQQPSGKMGQSLGFEYKKKMMKQGDVYTFDFKNDQVKVDCSLPVKRLFQVTSGDRTVSMMLRRWAAVHGFQVFWNADFDVALTDSAGANFLFNEDLQHETMFLRAAGRLLNSMRDIERIPPLLMCSFDEKVISIHSPTVHGCKKPTPTGDAAAPLTVKPLINTPPQV